MTMTGERCADCPFARNVQETIGRLEDAGEQLTTKATSNDVDDYAERVAAFVASHLEIDSVDADEIARNLRKSAAAKLDTLDEVIEAHRKMIDDATSSCDEPLTVFETRNGVEYRLDACTSPTVVSKKAPFEAFIDDNEYLKYIRTVGSAATRVTRTEDYND